MDCPTYTIDHNQRRRLFCGGELKPVLGKSGEVIGWHCHRCRRARSLDEVRALEQEQQTER